MKYKKEEKKQGVTIVRIEWAYLELAESHRELRSSYEMIKKREKRKDKFFSKMWKGVKGQWNILKPLEKLPSPE